MHRHVELLRYKYHKCHRYRVCCTWLACTPCWNAKPVSALV